DYPRGLKLFAQYVLIPLVSVYLGILTAYLFKVVITTEWPSGWIGWLVSCVSVAGILSILLTHPIRDRRENAWIVTYGRWFWLVMIPSIGMLLVAAWKRIDQYGITEPRYFLVVLTVWLAAMAVVYGFVRSQNIKWLPLTLCALSFLTFLGPWSAYAVSEASQLGRLEGLLARNGLLVEGRAVPPVAPGAAGATTDTVPTEDRRQIGAALTYLFAHHGSEPLVPLLGPELAVSDSLGGTDPVREWVARDRAADVMAALDLEFVDARPSVEGPGGQFHVQTDPAEVVDVSGYDLAFEAGRHSSVRVAGRLLDFNIDVTEVVVKSGERVVLSVPLVDAVERALEYARTPAAGPDGRVPRELLRIEVSVPGVDVAFVPSWMSGRRVGGRIEVDQAHGLWLMRLEEGAFGQDSVASPAPTTE
ncbi:MAG TPA: DUF4153 domain-containing protein, partial [Alphaproteobacteria bacterium]|nr:DUF4153 domain-containing protein [Alphaproteobacteria bacterium]